MRTVSSRRRIAKRLYGLTWCFVNSRKLVFATARLEWAPMPSVLKIKLPQRYLI